MKTEFVERLIREDEHLIHQIENRERKPNLCTIYPPDAEGIKRMSTWITAKGESFVDLAEKQ